LKKHSRLLLDTHILLWWWFNDKQLSLVAREAIANPENILLVSAASIWEISTKYRLGKLAHAQDAVERMDELMQASDFSDLPITRTHTLLAGSFTHTHKDPFDRMIAAQSLQEAVPIITADPMIAALGAETLYG
jgi:PIN domain nuclease of toxin-antitoxin system